MPLTQAKPGHLQITLSFWALLEWVPHPYIISISTTGVPIWTADSVVNGTTSTSAAVVDSGGVFQFLSNGNLRLVNGSGATVWTSNTAKLGVTSASLDDTGNLVLAANTLAVWSSFENPTDTLVPSQNFTVNQTLRSGVYSFQLRSDGNITLTWNESVVYWNQGLSSLSASNVTSPTLRLQPNGILTLSDASLRRSENVAFANDYDVGADVVRFMRLSSDGNLRMYSGGTTAMTWAALADQCQVYGYCGNMGICSYMESSLSPICKCPSLNFEAVDVNDRRKGCKRKVEVENCAGNVTMLELKQTKFFTFQDQQIVTIGITACRGNCLSSPSCFASTSLSDTNAWCYMKNTPDFVSGYQGPVLLSTSFLKVCGPVQPNPSPLEQSGGDKKCSKLYFIWAGGVVATISVMAASSGLFWWFCSKNSPKFGSVLAQYTLLEYASEINEKFSEWAYGEFEKGNVEAIVDRRLADQVVDMEEVTRAVQVSFWCIQEHPSRRPTMGKVVQMLEGIIEIGMPPPLKALTGESSCGTSTNLASIPTSLFIFIFIISNSSHTAFHFRENYGEAIFIVVTIISNQISLAFMVFTSSFFVQPTCN
ncbi:G-TYPE LECTIN S-RECEPTOR SERINE/THREONINE-PROTEIN KINASE [Salix koriyanagi]|uniref:G-TYPE LECTIN S-RECEPTOR SERINE/THREONINE-PROTEIN KINASE n=1 Tax=Salix koriyanagi TaxID=2511006 RepID=A0A9Q1A8E2_9ROSI|nr:G-TYPE LECTIN S-RECEPTOR SERINE/THREONINE-PROTEIN KINASE [Salix koriyanagi]